MKPIILAIATAIISISLHAQGIKMAVESSGEIISGGPTVEAAKSALETRLKEESEGKITLNKFQSTKAKFPNPDMRNNSHCEFGFEAQIEFSEPGQWVFRQNDKALTFTFFKAGSQRITNSDAIDILKSGEQYMIFGSVWFTPITNAWVSSHLKSSTTPKSATQFFEERCFENLRYISAALAQYQIEHNGKSPFDVSTNSGGTLEFCVRDSEGNDKNSAAHYKTLSDFLSKASTLVCPADSTKQAASNFQSLRATNVTYLLRSIAKDPAQFQRIITICPIHGYVLDDGGGIEKK